MLEIDNVLIDEDITKSFFVCDLKRCKGACCQAGDAGAALKDLEATQITDNLEKILPFLPQKNQDFLKEQTPLIENHQALRTNCMENGQCVFVINENNSLSCGIEKAFRANKIDFNKPISCHLYPIRVRKYDIEGEIYELLYYHQWLICSPACELGSNLQIPLYVFLKEALIRAYGEDFYQNLLNQLTP